MPKPNSDCRVTERKHPWPMVRLGDVCEFSRGLTYSKSDEVQVSSNVVLRSNNVDLGTGCLVFDELKYIRDSIEIPKSKRVSKGAILMCTANGSKQHLGKVALIDDDYDYAFGGFMGLLTPNDSINSRYLYWQLMSFEFKRHVTTLTDGTNINNLKFADIAQFTFPLPPLSVQREIVARLERELAVVEKIKKDFEAIAETAKAEFKAELKEVFEEISRGGAETRRLGEVCETISDCPHTTAKDEGVGIPLIRTPNVGFTRLMLAGVHRVSEDVYKQRTKRAIPLPGDLIFAREAPAGNVAVIQPGEKVCLGQRTVLLRLRKGCFPDYIAYSVLQPESQKILIQKSTGSTVAHVNVCDIKVFPIPLPPLSAQREVVARLDGAKEKAGKLEAKAWEGVAVCETMRKAILKEAFE